MPPRKRVASETGVAEPAVKRKRDSKASEDEAPRRRSMRAAAAAETNVASSVKEEPEAKEKPKKTSNATSAGSRAKKTAIKKEEAAETSPAKPKGPDKRASKAKETSEPSKKAKPAAASQPKAGCASGKEAERDASGRAYWLMKAEPETRLEKGVDVRFSIDDLEACEEPEPWDGVRNPVARNNMRAMKKGDLAFFYHSNCKIPGVAGVMEIVQEHSPDESAFDPKHPYYDPKSDRESPKWSVVHVEFRKKFEEFISLKKLQEYRGAGQELADLQVLRMSRLSVSRVTPAEWIFICKLAGEDPTSFK